MPIVLAVDFGRSSDGQDVTNRLLRMPSSPSTPGQQGRSATPTGRPGHSQHQPFPPLHSVSLRPLVELADRQTPSQEMRIQGLSLVSGHMLKRYNSMTAGHFKGLMGDLRSQSAENHFLTLNAWNGGRKRRERRHDQAKRLEPNGSQESFHSTSSRLRHSSLRTADSFPWGIDHENKREQRRYSARNRDVQRLMNEVQGGAQGKEERRFAASTFNKLRSIGIKPAGLGEMPSPKRSRWSVPSISMPSVTSASGLSFDYDSQKESAFRRLFSEYHRQLSPNEPRRGYSLSTIIDRMRQRRAQKLGISYSGKPPASKEEQEVTSRRRDAQTVPNVAPATQQLGQRQRSRSHDSEDSRPTQRQRHE